eukprot:SAG11_NODE_1426_length_4943_cov_7.372419_6_plen_124_part_00
MVSAEAAGQEFTFEVPPDGVPGDVVTVTVPRPVADDEDDEHMFELKPNQFRGQSKVDSLLEWQGEKIGGVSLQKENERRLKNAATRARVDAANAAREFYQAKEPKLLCIKTQRCTKRRAVCLE